MCASFTGRELTRTGVTSPTWHKEAPQDCGDSMNIHGTSWHHDAQVSLLELTISQRAGPDGVRHALRDQSIPAMPGQIAWKNGLVCVCVCVCVCARCICSLAHWGST